MNVAESNGVEAQLKARGWTPVPDPHQAQLVIINTCSVRITAEQRVFGRLGFFSGLKKQVPLKILVMGCMAERLKPSLNQDFPFVDYVVGITDRESLEDIFARLEKQEVGLPLIDGTGEKYLFPRTSYREGDFQSFVPIMNGCNNFCTYCIVPYLRGREVSRSVHDILTEIDFLCEKNVKEITLLGQNVNSYHSSYKNAEVDFPALLRLICRHLDNRESIRWIRFVSSHPKDLSDGLIDVIRDEPKICKAIHLPVQHGSDVILRAMNRNYTAEQYKNLVKKLRDSIPNIALTTDILVGFPGETEEDVEQTLQLMREVAFTSAFMYHYNPREGTKAFDLPARIPDDEKIRRLQKVIDLQQEISKTGMQKKLGTETAVLLESVSKKDTDRLFGHTEAGEMVVIKNTGAERIGQFVQVRLEKINGKTFVGTVV